MKRILFFTALIFCFQSVLACAIFVITDGEKVLIGNHEDWYAQDAEITFTPAENGKHGTIIFDFASEGWAQGGMNTKGLFFDGTATPEVAIDQIAKEDCDCYIWEKILAECANVEEAVAMVKKYKVPEFKNVHILLADKTGKSVIIGAYKGELFFEYKNEDDFQVLTNFNIADATYGGEPLCTRFATAEMMLMENSEPTIENARQILENTHQGELTVYSNIYDLSNRYIYVYSKADFTKSHKFNLETALQKGKHSIAIAELFSEK